MGLKVITQLEISALRNRYLRGKMTRDLHKFHQHWKMHSEFQMEYCCLSSPLSNYTCLTQAFILTHIYLFWDGHTCLDLYTLLDTDTPVLIQTHQCLDTDTPVLIQTHLSWNRHTCLDTNTLLDTDSPVLIQTHFLIQTHLSWYSLTCLDTDTPVLIQTHLSWYRHTCLDKYVHTCFDTYTCSHLDTDTPVWYRHTCFYTNMFVLILQTHLFWHKNMYYTCTSALI